MGDQDKNFGVSWSWFDMLVGTREVFVGSERERAGFAKHAARAQTASSGAVLRAQRRSPLRRLLARTVARPA
jgi:sterol desaturase/sphingolipid hydroxylase (fatty acid hydroxylase superfamily)